MTILVAYVARPEGQAALDKAIEVATRRSERLIVVNAAPGGSQDDTIVNGYEVERVEERLAQLPIQAEFKQFVRGNSTLDEILHLIDAEQISLLVIGLRKRTAVGKLLLGSMAQEILMSAPCPVLAVKAP
ncbi:MAG: universal stress protein [Comamonadaceae bacterium]|jgi:nucleotide-binding universal stress UspA family protein|nr:universal stress protein [Comamonadaceae bacterium]